MNQLFRPHVWRGLTTHLRSLLDWPKGSPFPLLMGAFLRLQSGFSSISPLSPVAVISGKNCVACKQEMFICLLSEVRRGPLGAFNTFVCVLRCVDMLLFLTSVLHLWFATSLEIYVANLHGKISSSAVINSPLYVYTCGKTRNTAVLTCNTTLYLKWA